MGRKRQSLERTAADIERFWSRVNKSDGVDACWLWTGKPHKDGYGVFGIGKKLYLAHRVSYEIANREIPSGLNVLHSCDNPPCCNPAHLFLGTQLDNVRDRDQKGRGNPSRGEKNGNAKLTDAQIESIRTQYAQGGISQYALAREFDIDQPYVCRIVNRSVRK